MNNYIRFTPDEVPYGMLEKYGLTQQMLEDLPKCVMQRFLTGQPTPALPVVSENIEGIKTVTPTRITLVRLSDGTVDVSFAPRWTDKDLSDFTAEQQDNLLKGNVIVTEMPNKGKCFLQFDDSINKVIGVPSILINKNISLLIRSYGLDDGYKATLENGGVIEIKVNDQVVSAGIDLNEPSGIRTADGDIIAWQQDANADRLPKYSFGLFGCWVADDSNILTYVPEEQYDEDMEREFTRSGQANAAAQTMKMN